MVRSNGNYILEGNGNETQLTVELDIDEQYAESFDKMFPNALKIVKELSELY